MRPLRGIGASATPTFVEFSVDRRLAVAAIRSDRGRDCTDKIDDSVDGGYETGSVGGHPRFDLIVHDETIEGVGHLTGVTELGRLRE